MPSVCSKVAPHFSGELNQPIEDFLDEFEGLADRCGLTGPQKVEAVIRYVNWSQCHIWQHLPGFINWNWINFCNKLHAEYVSPTPEGQFSRQKLINFTSQYAQNCMEDETDIINYQHKFNAQSKSLLSMGRIMVGKCNAIFWCSFHPDDQQALRKRLIAMHPNKLQGQAFNLKDIFDIARAIFSGNNNFLLQEPLPCPDPDHA